MKIVTKSILKKIYRKRPREAKKYDFGLLIVIGGSDFYSGSPALSALAAFRAGVDMVRIIAPKRAADIIASFSPNLATFALEGKYLTKEHLPTIFSLVKGAKAVSNGKAAIVIGGGMGRTRETQEAILEFLKEVFLPVVIDADAIHALSKDLEIIKGKPFLFTPHLYEFFILTSRDLRNLPEKEKIPIVKEEAKRLKTTILLKGATDIISDGEKIALNKTGSPYLTVGGTGDTLAGIAGALISRGISIFEAACAAAYINGLAGEKAAEKFGEGLTATDLIETIPEILK